MDVSSFVLALAREPIATANITKHGKRFSGPPRGVIDEDAPLDQAQSSCASFGRARSASLEQSAYNAARGFRPQHNILSPVCAVRLRDRAVRRFDPGALAPRDPPVALRNAALQPLTD
jgi:hypothetical protein